MKKITTLFLGFLIISCGAVEDDMDETVNTPEPTPVTFGEWTPAFSEQREDFTQTRTGSDGSNQTRTITVSSSIVGTEDVYEMEDNQDYNNDGDMFDVAEIVQTRYLTTPNVGAIVYVDIEVVHNNNGTNQITFNGESYPINFLSIYKEDTNDDKDYIIGFHQLSEYYNYKPIPINQMSFFLESDNSENLSFGKYETKYLNDEIEEIQIPLGFTQTNSDKYLTIADTYFGLGRFDFEPFVYLGAVEGIICGNGNVPYFSPDAEYCGYDQNKPFNNFNTDILNAEIHYKEFNNSFFISIKGTDYSQRPFHIFYNSNQHIYISENNVNGTCYGGIDEYTYNNNSLPFYQNFMPYSTLRDGTTEDCQYGNWYDLSPSFNTQFFSQYYSILSEGQIHSVVTEDVIIQRLYTMQVTGGWVDFYQNTFGYTPQQVNVAKLKLNDLQGPEHPSIEVYYDEYGYVEFLRVGIDDNSTPTGFHMYNFEYEYWKYLNQETKDYISSIDGSTNEFNDVSETIGFYLFRYLKDLRNDAIVRYE